MKVFISYRRSDSQHVAGRIYERLVQHLGSDNVFMDVDSIRYGDDFRERIMDFMAGCDALIAIIGDAWLTAQDDEGERRLDNENDFVRIEIQTALSGGVTVIPVLVGKKAMPGANELPVDLKRLAFCHGIHIRPDPHFSSDFEHLVRHLDCVPEAGTNEISMFDYFMSDVDWSSLDADRKQIVQLLLSLLLACVEGRQINTDKLARLVTKVSGGKLGFEVEG